MTPDREQAGADEQVAVLAARAAADAALDDSGGIDGLLRELRKAGAEDQARLLAERLPAVGWFYHFSEQPENETRYRFGREPDGNPAPPWGWDDLN